MLIKTNDIRDILEQKFGWLRCPIPVVSWQNGTKTLINKIIFKHPSKKLYYFDGVFGKSYRVYMQRKINIMHRYFECGYYDKYELDEVNGILSHDNFIGLYLK